MAPLVDHPSVLNALFCLPPEPLEQLEFKILSLKMALLLFIWVIFTQPLQLSSGGGKVVY